MTLQSVLASVGVALLRGAGCPVVQLSDTDLAAVRHSRECGVPLSAVDAVSADLERRQQRYTHRESRGARALVKDRYKRTHEVLRGHA